MEIPKYIVFRVDVMKHGTSVELTNITDDVEDVILKTDLEKPKIYRPEENCNNCKNKESYECRYCTVSTEAVTFIETIPSRYEPQETLCRECDDYAGDGMICASNYLVYDFSTSAENCETEPKEDNPQ